MEESDHLEEAEEGCVMDWSVKSGRKGGSLLEIFSYLLEALHSVFYIRDVGFF